MVAGNLGLDDDMLGEAALCGDADIYELCTRIQSQILTCAFCLGLESSVVSACLPSVPTPNRPDLPV